MAPSLWFQTPYKALLLLAAGLLCASLLSGQQGTGTISGVVTDPQDALVAGAKVEVQNVDTGSVFRTTTNEQGGYTAPGLAIGRYAVRAEREGFKKAVRSGITLQVNQNAQVNLVLQLGQLAEVVEVVAEAALADSTSATIGTVIENRQVQALPLNGRGALALTLLTPGVVSNAGPTNAGFGDRGVQISSISINGSPNSMNAQMLDGNNNTLSYLGEVGVPPAVDAVEEFKVQSGPMSAEFGFTAGGVINLVTKSGTNEIHGTLYHFFRNDKLDARNAFAPVRLPFRYNQYGGTAGGPFIRNRTFGFFNYEGYKLRRSSPRIASMPVEAWREGNFSTLFNANGSQRLVYDPATIRPNPAGGGQVRQAFPGNIVPANRLDRITPGMMKFWPSPNKAPINALTQEQNFQDSALSLVDWAQVNFKVDHRFTDRNSMFVRYTSAQHAPFADSFFTDPTVGPNRRDDQTNRNAVVSDTHTFSPTLINNLRVGIMRQSFTFESVNTGQDWPRKLGLPEIVPNDQMPAINFGYGTIGGAFAGFRGSHNWDIQNLLTKVWGNHTLKAGYNHRIMQGNNLQGGGLSGTYAFSGLTNNPQSPAGTGSDLAQFLLGEVSSSSIDRVLGNSWQGRAQSLFIQDDWRLSRRLTLNLGLRYDFQQKPYERNNGHINLDLAAVEPITGRRGAVVYAGVNGQPRSFMNEDYNDFAPRLGFAFDLLGNGKTILRGGYGIFYPSIFYSHFFGNMQLFSVTNTQYVSRAPGERAFLFSQGFPFAPITSPGAAAGPSAVLGQSSQYREQDSTTPISQQWNFSVQQQFGSWLVDATYAANKGNHFVSQTYNLNQIDPVIRRSLGQTLFDPVPNPLAGKVPGGLGAANVQRERTLMPYPQYTSVIVSNPRVGNYVSHLLLLNVKRRFRQGLLLDISYTTGKKISDSQQAPVDFGPIEQVNDQAFQDGLYNRRLERATDPTDVARRFVTSLVYEIPVGSGKLWDPGQAFLRGLLGGWQINSIIVAQTGLPLTVRGANNFQADRPDSTGVSAKLETRTAQRWFDTTQFRNPAPFTVGNVGRTIPDVRHPGTLNIDFSLIKETRIGERFRLQFRAEAFNLTNKVNLGLANDGFVPGPDGRNNNLGFGTITSSRDARIGQLALKLFF